MAKFWQRYHDSLVSGDVAYVEWALLQDRDVVTCPLHHGITPLQLASKHGHVDIVRILFRYTESSVRNDRDYCSCAMNTGLQHLDIIKLFVETPCTWPPNGGELTLIDLEYVSVLISRALLNGHSRTASYLLELYPEFRGRKEEMMAVVYLSGGDEYFLKSRISRIMNYNYTEDDQFFKGMATELDFRVGSAGSRRCPRLDVVTRTNEIERMSEVYEQIPADLRQNCVNSAGRVACQSGHVETMKWLLERELQTHVLSDDESKNLLFRAASFHNTGIVDLLLSRQKQKLRNPWRRQKFQKVLNKCLLTVTRYHCDEDVVKILLHFGAKDKNGNALISACNYGNSIIVGLLLRKHLKNIKLMKRCLTTALRSDFDSLPTIELLLETGYKISEDYFKKCPSPPMSLEVVAYLRRVYSEHNYPPPCHQEAFRLLIQYKAESWCWEFNCASCRFLMMYNPQTWTVLSMALDYFDYADLFPRDFLDHGALDNFVEWSFLPKLLERMCGSRKTVIQWDHFLVVLMTEGQLSAYSQAIQQSGFTVVDKGFGNIEATDESIIVGDRYENYVRSKVYLTPKKMKENYETVELLTRRPMLSLKSLARISVRKRLRAGNERTSMLDMLRSLHGHGVPYKILDFLSFGELGRHARKIDCNAEFSDSEFRCDQ